MQDKNRRCVVTGQIRPWTEMIRFVAAPGGNVIADVEGRLPGRGYWVVADRRVLSEAVTKGRLRAAVQRHSAEPVTVPADLLERTVGLLKARVLTLLGLARRSGDLVAGFDSLIHSGTGVGKLAMLIHAADAAMDGKRKLGNRFEGLPAYGGFSRAELSQALGRENLTHLGLKRSRLADKIRLEMTRLAGIEATAEDRAVAVARKTRIEDGRS